MDRTDQDRALLTGLVGDRVALYQTNAVFKVAVDTLAKMLPMWVDGLAAHAEADAVRFEAARAALMRDAKL